MRALKLTAILGATMLALALLAAWQIPPRMDWDRYRGALAAFASAKMGRTVTVGGQVRLMLLPDPVLVADRVSLADRGDGVSATIGALRLRIGLADLLHGRLVPRRLELDDPVVRLPWPLPRGAAQAVPTRVEGGFTASVEGGALMLGGVTLSGISAGVQTDPDTGAFAAKGEARLGTLPCRFTALIGAPGSDGVSTLTATVDGQGAAQGAGGSLRGRVLASGVQGQLALRGPSLAKLMPGPDAAWRLDGYITAAQDQVQARQLDVMLGNSPGQASATLTLGAAPLLEVSAQLGQMALGPWAWRAANAAPKLAMRLDLAASAAVLMGGTLRDAHAVVALGGGGAARISAQATLPGGTRAQVDGAADGGKADGGKAGQHFSGALKLAAQNVPVLLAWLRPLAPAVVDALPAPPPGAELAGTLSWQPGRVRLADIAGHLGGGAVSGSVEVAAGKRPSVQATLVLDRLALPAPEGGGFWAAARAWPGLPAAPFAAFDAALDIAAGAASVGGVAASHLVLQGNGGADGFVLSRLAADLPGAHLEAAGAFGRGGGLRDVRVDLGAADAAALRLPVKLPDGLWQGPLHLALTANGPPEAMTAQLRGDLGDVRAEAEAVLDSTAPKLTATVTLRHPGGPRLLAQAGLAGPFGWLGQGSVAFLAHLAAAPGQMTASDFSLGAGALRVGGQLGIDLSGALPEVDGRVDAPVLTLPKLPGREALLPFWLLKGWQGRLVVSAGQVSAGPALLAENGAAVLTVADGAALADGVSASVAGGHFTGQAAVDATVALPTVALRGAVQGAAVDQLPALPGLDFSGGTLDLAGAVNAAGNSGAAMLATLAGDVQGTLHGAALRGVDLARPAAWRGRRGVAAAAADSGALDGGFDAVLESGVLSLQDAALRGAAGSVGISGSIDLSSGAPDLLLRVAPPHGAPVDVRVPAVGRKRAALR